MIGSRILVVDDNHDMAGGIAMLLEEAGASVQVAHSAPAALTELQGSEFELVLSDIRMPAMSGLDLLRDIGARWPLTKVVLVTAHGTLDSAVGALRSGASDYLTKPFDNDELLRVVERALTAGPAAGGFDPTAVVGEIAAALCADELLPSLKRALDVLLRATGADDGEVFLSEPENRFLVLSSWSGPDGDALTERTRFDCGSGFPGLVAATGKSLCVKGDLKTDVRYLRTAVTRAGICSLVAAPLSDARGVMGSIHLMSRRSDFAVERVCGLLERAAVPIGSTIRAALGTLRQQVDSTCSQFGAPAGPALRVLVESMRQLAGAHDGTLAVLDAAGRRPGRVASTGPASLVCKHVESGAWSTCPTVVDSQYLLAETGRRHWPEACRSGLPRRATSPCCLPLAEGDRFHGLAVLDFGRRGIEQATGSLVPLLTIANQIAIRLRSDDVGAAVGAGLPHASEVVGGPSEAELVLSCLGPFQVYRRGQLISAEAFSRSKALLVLKQLALRAGAPIHREVLIELLWPEVDPHLGINRLHGVMHDLRSVIEPQRAAREWTYVRNRGELYFLDMQSPVEIDLVRWRQGLSAGLRAARDGKSQLAIEQLERAVSLYRGELFADDTFAEWCKAEREQCRDEQARALVCLARLHEKQGRFDAALGHLATALRIEPLRDDLLMDKMSLLDRLGRRSEALGAYNDHCHTLDAELGTEPSVELRRLADALLT